MRRSLISCVIVVLLVIAGCGSRNKQPVPTPSDVPFPPPPALINTALPDNHLIFVEIRTETFGTENVRCDPHVMMDGPWLYEYFWEDHHLVIHYVEPGREIAEGHVLVGYRRELAGSAGGGLATDNYDIVEELPYEVSGLDDTRIVAADASGSIVIEVAGQEYWLEPGQTWYESEDTVQDDCRVRISRRLKNYGLMNLDQVYVNR